MISSIATFRVQAVKKWKDKKWGDDGKMRW